MKLLIILTFGVLSLTGCMKNDGELSVESKNPVTIESTTETDISESVENHPNIQTSGNEESFPYAVAFDKLVGSGFSSHALYSAGVNAPPLIIFENGVKYGSDLAINIYSFEYSEGARGDPIIDAIYSATITNIPTKEITLFNGPGSESGERSVKVNTQLQLKFNKSYEESAFPFETFDGDIMYLFYNNQGKLSLATRNYAGNVGAEDIDTMMEYVQE